MRWLWLTLGVALAACNAEDGSCDHPFDVSSLPYESHIDLSTMQSSLSFRDEPGPCVAPGQYGNDAVFAVEMTAGQMLTATMTCQFESASLYAVFDCDRSLSPSQCIDGASGAPAGSPYQISFVADADGTSFVVVDHQSTTLARGSNPLCDLRIEVE